MLPVFCALARRRDSKSGFLGLFSGMLRVGMEHNASYGYTLLYYIITHIMMLYRPLQLNFIFVM